jgi:hypothetical protein
LCDQALLRIDVNLLFLLFSQIIALPEQADIQLEIIGQASNNPNWAFFAPHENENVVNHYVSKQIQDKGGVFVILRQQGERLIHLNIEPFTVRIDPNRIFTQAGRRKNIIKLNPKLRENTYVFHRAMRRSASLAQLILNALGGKDSSRTWVAIHNNTQGFRGDDNQGIGDISIHLYRKKLAAGASFLAAASEPMLDEDDLFFVTEQEDYVAMQQDGWNVVLQHPQVIKKASEDDGSLSVFAHKNGIRYINIEAERSTASFGVNHFELQSKMVDYVLERLQSKLIQQAPSNSLTRP